VINRRNIGSASLSALESIHDKDRWKTVGQDAFFLLTTVNHISVHPEMVDFGFRQGPSEFSTADIARYFED